MTETPNRCRLVLIVPPQAGDDFASRLSAALSGGDVASVLIPSYGADEASFQALAEQVVPLAQQAGAAAIVADDTRIAGRVKADGIHLEVKASELAEAVRQFQPRLSVGAGGATTRDDALDIGELQPDYLFFGKFGYDTKPEPHRRNLSLGQWWSDMIQIPCIVLGGSDIASVEAVAATGADFVALSAAVFGEGVDPAEAVRTANALLDETAPRFEG